MPTPLATAFVRIRPLATGFGKEMQAQLDAQSGAASAAGAKAGSAYSGGMASRLNTSMAKIGKMLALPLAGAAVASVDLAVKFDASMQRLSTQAGVPQAKLAGLKAGVLSLAGQVGLSPDSLAESLFHVESNFQSLGITSTKALGLVKIAAEGAATGGADLVDVTNALTAVMASGIKGATNMQGAMGALNAIVGAGDMKMQDLAQAFGSGMVATVKGFGLSLNDVGAALATFGDNNIRGALAGTQLRMSVMALAAPAKAGAATLVSWGEKTGSLATAMRKGGLIGALDELHGLFVKNGVTAKEQGEVITQMFGKRAGAGLNVLMDQLDRIKSKYPDIAKGASSFGDAWKQTQQTASQQFKTLEQGIVAMGIRIGNALLPSVLALMRVIRGNLPVILALAGAFTAAALAAAVYNSALVQGSIRIVVWAAAQSASLIETAALWVMYTVGVESAAAATVIATGGMILIAAALAIGIVEVIKHWRDFKQWAIDAWHGLEAAAKAVWSFLKQAFGDILNWGTTAFHAVVGAAEDVFSWIHDHWHLLAALLFGPFGLAVDAIVTHWSTVRAALLDVWHWINNVWRDVEGFLRKPVVAAVDAIVRYFKMEWDGILAVYHWLDRIWRDVENFLRAPVDAAVQLIQRDWDSLLSGLKTLKNGVMVVWNNTIGWLITAGKNLIVGLFKGATDWAGHAASWAAHIGSTIVTAFKNFFGIKSPSTVFLKMGENLINALGRGMLGGAKGIASWALKSVKNLGSDAWSALKSFLGFGSSGSSTQGGSAGTAATGAAQQYGKSLMQHYGWGPGQWGSLQALWNGESGWRWDAQNKSSGAYGIPQALPAAKMASAGADWLTDYKTQIRWGERYIKDVYGTPAAAYSAWLGRSPHWYAKGGVINEPVMGIGKSGRTYGFGEAGSEVVTSERGLADLAGLLADIRDALGAVAAEVRANSGDTAAGVAAALGGAARSAGYRGSYSPGWG
jgi:TP901 family phage tail tape measure protein